MTKGPICKEARASISDVRSLRDDRRDYKIPYPLWYWWSTYHHSLEQELSLKIEERDQTIWICILEL